MTQEHTPEAAAPVASQLPCDRDRGRIYSRGLGVAVDAKEARNWYSQAVAQEGKVVVTDELREAKAFLAVHS